MERKGRRRSMELRASLSGKILPMWWYRCFPHLRGFLIFVTLANLLRFMWNIQLSIQVYYLTINLSSHWNPVAHISSPLISWSVTMMSHLESVDVKWSALRCGTSMKWVTIFESLHLSRFRVLKRREELRLQKNSGVVFITQILTTCFETSYHWLSSLTAPRLPNRAKGTFPPLPKLNHMICTRSSRSDRRKGEVERHFHF